MKQLISLLFIIACIQCQAQWTITGNKIVTAWAAQVDPAKPLPEYPRPQMVRKDWTNLNGLWEYTILPKAQTTTPTAYQGNLLVPYPVESALSGVSKTVGKDSILWYKKNIVVTKKSNNNVLLHFGAVDWQCKIYLNGKIVGDHSGGYDPFTIDITNALTRTSQQELVVMVWDPSDDGPQPRGKQQKNPRGIWYTPVTGIWQTVWMEQVPASYINTVKQTPDVDGAAVIVESFVSNAIAGDKIMITAYDGTAKVVEQLIDPNIKVSIPVLNPKLWSPASPFLYDLTYTLMRKGKMIDKVSAYFAMRKISLQPDQTGLQRMMLNNEFVFQYGPLDQGWWPDGLYTAPTDAALKFDIEQTKAMGFNMIRKHVKVEPARWYYYCDKLGILVWQDMPSGDMGNQWDSRPGIIGKATEKNRTTESENVYRTEWKEIMKDLYNFPSIVVWVPFNEAWGQFKTKEITDWTMQNDPSRLVNSASGGNFHDAGQIFDLHNYPEPAMPDPAYYGNTKAMVLGEFGGLGLPIENHTWQEKNNWGYQTFQNKKDLYNRYADFINRIPAFIAKGLSAAVYTQTTDVEVETNGLMTYDRKEIKFPVDSLHQLHQQLYNKSLVKMGSK